METYPNISKGQFTVQFLDRNTGIVLDHEFNYGQVDRYQKVYSVHHSLKKAIEYADSRKISMDYGTNNIGYYIRDEKENIILHTDNLTKNAPAPTKTIIIDGENFSDMEGFYNEIDKILTSELDWDTGHNLDALNDLLRGGFGVFDYGSIIELVWNNSAKSKKDLKEPHHGQSLYEIITEIIKEHDHIYFKEK